MPQAVPAGRAAGIGWPLRGGPPNPDAVASARVTATNPGGHRRDDRAEADPVDEKAGGDDPDRDRGDPDLGVLWRDPVGVVLTGFLAGNTIHRRSRGRPRRRRARQRPVAAVSALTADRGGVGSPA